MIVEIIAMWGVTALGLWVAQRFVTGVKISSVSSLWIGALVLGLVNAFVRPLLLWLTLPLTILSFGLFVLVINAFMIKLTASLVRDFEVSSFSAAMLAAVIMALFNLVASMLVYWLFFDGVHWLYINESVQGQHHGLWL